MSCHAVLTCLALTILMHLPLLHAQETKDEPTVNGDDMNATPGPDGRYSLRRDPKPYTGCVVFTSKSGGTSIVREKLYMVDGLKHGVNTRWHIKGDGTRGGVRSETQYERGKRQGTEKTYYENGQLSSLYTYKDDVEDGPYETYYETGKLQSQTSMKNGKKDGVHKSWSPNGNLGSEVNYKAGCRHGTEKLYYENGQMESEGSYLAEERKNEDGTTRLVDVKDGVFKKYRETGVLESATTYVRDGLRRRKTFDSSGVLDREELFKEDGRGIERSYWRDGRVRGEFSKKTWHGRQHGTTKSYYESGQLEALVTYRTDEGGQTNKHGRFVYYKKDGTISSQGYCRDNQEVETPVEGPPDPEWEDDPMDAKEPAKVTPPDPAQPPEEPAGDNAPKDAEIESLLAESSEALKAADYAKIMAVTGKLLKLDPRNKWAWLRRGIALAHLDLPEDAVKAYRKCVELAPDFPNGHYQLGLALHDQGDFPAAISAMTRAAELFADPTDVADSYYALADWHRGKENYDPAIVALELAIRSDPKHFSSLALLGACYRNKKRYDDAIAMATRAAAVNPAHAYPRVVLADAYIMTDQPDRALPEYKKAFELDPNDPYPAKVLAVLYREKGELKAAADWYQRYLKLKPDDQEVRNVYDEILKQLGEDGGSRATGGTEVAEAGPPTPRKSSLSPVSVSTSF